MLQAAERLAGTAMPVGLATQRSLGTVPISSHGVAVSGGHLEPVEAGAEGSGEGVYRSGLLFDNSNSAGAGGGAWAARMGGGAKRKGNTLSGRGENLVLGGGWLVFSADICLLIGMIQ